jgi:hypothetical protein
MSVCIDLYINHLAYAYNIWHGYMETICARPSFARDTRPVGRTGSPQELVHLEFLACKVREPIVSKLQQPFPRVYVGRSRLFRVGRG